MPGIRDASTADRSLGQRINTHPRRNGDLILAPDDILEGIGNFLEYDASGNPVGWRLGQVEMPDGRHVYAGRTPDNLIRITARPLDYERPSMLLAFDLPEVGPPPPNPGAPMLAQIPRPPAATLRAMPATVDGYPASTPAKPHWFALAWVKDGTILTAHGPAVPFQLAQGQSAKVQLPARSSLPEGTFHVALLMATPGSSTATSPGPMHVQRIVDLRRHQSQTYELSGPFRSEGTPAGRTNETTLPNPPAPSISRDHSDYGSRCANYTAAIVWTDASGDTLKGAHSRQVTIQESARYNVMAEEGTLVYKPGTGYVPADTKEVAFRAGEGRITVERGEAPKGATGWKVLLYIQPIHADADFSAGWRWVVSRLSQRGDSLPYPLSQRSVTTSGWEGSEEHYAKNDNYVCVDADLPSENATGVPTPEDAPPAPEAFGASRPEPGDLYVKVTDTVRGRESLPSRAARIKLDGNSIPSVVFVDPSNRLPNPAFVETDPNGDPLYWTITRTGGLARVEGSETDTFGRQLVLETDAPRTTATPTAVTDPRPLDDPNTPDYIDFAYDLEPPVTGAPSGSLEVVLVQELADATTTETVLRSSSAQGEYEDTVEIKGAGDVGTFRWHIQCLKWKLLYRMNGPTKNIRARIRHSRHRHDRHKRRLDRRRRKPPRKPPRPGRPPAIVQDPPEPPWSPETFPVPAPDRPADSGSVLQALDFDAAMPMGFVLDDHGSGSSTRTPGAAIGGSANGLRCAKTTAGSLSDASIIRAFPPPAAGFLYRHAVAIHLKNRFATLPTGGSIRMHEIATTGGTPLAWLEMATQLEQVRLSIDSTPTAAGQAQVTLDTTSHNLEVMGANEVQDVAVNTAPSAPGTMTINMAGSTQVVAPGGDKHSFTLSVNSSPSSGGDLLINVNGIQRRVPVVAANSRTDVAVKIAAVTWDGYTATSSGSIVTFTATQAGTKPNPGTNGNGTGVTMSLSLKTTGTYATREATASRIAALDFPGWTQAISPAGAHVVRFTAISAGNKADPVLDAGTTAASLAGSTVTAGFVDTRTQFAARIAAGSYPGWTQTVSSNVVVFTATTAGVRQKSSYRPQATGATGTISTLVQGSNGDLTAQARDANGTVQRRKIISAVAAGTVFDTDLQVSGAGTDRAVVSVWGSLSGATMQLLARFEDVDLTGLSAELVNAGVASESTASLTWELHCDEGSVTSGGKTFYRDHTATGQWAPQAVFYTDSGQPIRQDLFLQDGRAAVLPGEQYTLSLFARADVASTTPARPLVITGHRSGVKAGATSSTRELGDVTNSPGLTGKTGWTKYSLTVTIPPDVFEVSLASRDIGAAEIVVQEVVMSQGTEGKRTGLYKTSGEYIATFDLRTPRSNPAFKPWTHERIALGATVDQPLPSTTVAAQYRSAPPSPDDDTIPDQTAWSPFTSVGANVPDLPFVQAKFSPQGPGNATPAIKVGSPYCEYLLKLGPRRMSTLLTEDRSELPGGVAFAEVHEWSERTPDGRRRLPSGRLHDEPSLFPPFGHFPACKIMVFDQEAKRHLEENWKHPYVAEVFGQDAITIKLAAQPEFSRETKYVTESAGGHRQTVYTAPLEASEVTKAVPLPRPGALA